jgi:hypothetical protein
MDDLQGCLRGQLPALTRSILHRHGPSIVTSGSRGTTGTKLPVSAPPSGSASRNAGA